MIFTRDRIFWMLSILLLAAMACSLPVGQPTPIPSVLAVPTLAASVTIPAEPTTPVPAVPSELPTETLIPTALVTETATLPVGVFPTDTPTPTLEPVIADVMKVTNCRTGPGSNYDLVVIFQTGARLQVVARDQGGGFIFVQNPDKAEEQCYVLANNVRLTGDASILPQITPKSSPTAAPGFTATFKKFDLCKGNVFAQFVVVNTGSVPFRSAYIKVTNLRNNDSAEKSVNAFDLYTGCIIAKNIAPLNSGATGYLSSELFLHDPRGNKMRAIIQACTEKGLKGTCVNTVIEIKP
ncbi:MAG: hypothetical protein NTW32_05665 [Chloroflexi bacterium]|nr:hypothetical protein [Chloroflexota bacterium]